MKSMKNKLLPLLLVLTLMLPLFSSVNPAMAAQQATATNSAVQSTDASDTECATGALSPNMEKNELAEAEFTQIQTKEEMNEYFAEANKDNTSASSKNTASASEIPSFIDNSTSSCFPVIRSQGSIGSCTAWANAYYQLTYELNRSKGLTASSESNQASAMFLYNMLNDGYNLGTSAYEAVSYLKQLGCTSYDLGPGVYDYTSWSPTEEAWKKAQENKIEDIFQINLNPTYASTFITGPKDSDLDAVKTALTNGNILSFSTPFRTHTLERIPLNNSVPENSKYANQYIVSKCDTYQTTNGYRNYGYHRMVIVGYNDNIWVDINQNGIVEENEKGAFKIANSHGTSYANSGFAWFSYDALNSISSVSGVSSTNRYSDPIYSIYGYQLSASKDSKMYAKFTLNTARRNEVGIKIHATAQNKSTYSCLPFNGSNNSNPISFTGGNIASDGTFVIDLNNVIKDISQNTLKDYKWTIEIQDRENDNYPLTVKEVSIIDKENGKTYSSDITTDTLNGSTEVYTIDFSNPNKENETTIYYKGYSPAYIHYKIGNGNWTNVPGVQMESSTEQSGYTHKITIPLGTANTLTACFNNGSGSWDSDNGKNYTFSAGTYGYTGGRIVELDTSLKVTDFSTSSSVGGIHTPLTLTASATGGTAPYQYRFGYVRDGREATLSSYTSANSRVWTPYQEGIYNPFVDVMDADGTVVRKTISDFVIEGIKIKSLTTNIASPQKVGTSIIVTGEMANIDPKSAYNFYAYTVTKDGETQTLTKNADNTATWTPTQAGTYTITFTFMDYALHEFTKSIQYEIADTVENQTIIYYKGYSTPYIHYKIGNGNWTNVPGIQMESSSEQSGYTHKITIPLGTAEVLTACFNNGSGSWDSDNGKNYTFYSGTYGYTGGRIVELDTSLKVTNFSTSSSVGGIHTPLTLNASATGGTAPYQYRFGYVRDGREATLTSYTSTSSRTWTPYQEGIYNLFVDVMDAEGTVVRKTISDFVIEGIKIKSLTTNVASPQKVGTSIIITGEMANIDTTSSYNFYEYSVTKNGTTKDLTTNSNHTATWTPTEAGTYTITFTFSDYTLNKLTKSIQYVITDIAQNQTTIYYKGYSAPYIHYKIGNGNWTNVPGVLMTATSEKAGYTHKATIALGDATDLTVCFNDGNGNWDSRNGANYSFSVGTYTYSNGTITKIGD